MLCWHQSAGYQGPPFLEQTQLREESRIVWMHIDKGSCFRLVDGTKQKIEPQFDTSDVDDGAQPEIYKRSIPGRFAGLQGRLWAPPVLQSQQAKLARVGSWSRAAEAVMHAN
jgi:hypothetical protein